MSEPVASPTDVALDPAAREELIRSHLRKARERAQAQQHAASRPSRVPVKSPPHLQQPQGPQLMPLSPVSPTHPQQSPRPAFYSQFNSQPTPEASDDDHDLPTGVARPRQRSRSPDLSYYQSPPQRFQQPYRGPPPQMQARPRYPTHGPDPRQRMPPPTHYRGPPPQGHRPQYPQYPQNQAVPVRGPGRGPPPSLTLAMPPKQRKQYGPPPLTSPTRETMSSRFSVSADTTPDRKRPAYFDGPAGPGQQESADATPTQQGSTYATPLEWPITSSARPEPSSPTKSKPAGSQLTQQRSSSSLRPLQQASPSAKTLGSSSVATLDSASDMSKDEEDLDAKYANAQGGLGGLARQASIGKHGKPSLAHIQNTASHDLQNGRPDTPDASTLFSAALGASMINPGAQTRNPDVYQGGVFHSSTALVGPGSSADNLSQHEHTRESWNLSSNEKAAYNESSGVRKSGMLLSVPENDSALSESKRNSARSSFRKSHKSGSEFGVRDSTTSLPGLIRRALRLATSMEQNRTQSRWGSEWMTSSAASGNTGQSSASHQPKRKSGGSINTIINAFPLTPTGGTPQSQYGERAVNQWPQSQLRQMQQMSTPPSHYDDADYSAIESKRRCCGMPVWLLVLIVLLVVVLVAAAIAIPIVLVVIPRQHSSTSNSGPTASQCAATTLCANGGSSFVTSDGSCSCVCSNGYTGANCEQQATSVGCATIAVAGNENATIGSALPALLSSASTDYNIALDAATLMSLFAQSSLSCSSQNALVTLNGAASSSRLRHRQVNITSVATLNFARIGILYVYQADRSLDDAIAAQSGVQGFLLQPTLSDPTSVTLTAQWTANFVMQTLHNTATGKTVGT